MPIDPNIPLGVESNIPLQAGKPSGPFGPDLKSLLTMQELAQRMNVVKQAQQDQNALRNVFSQAGNLDEKTGYLSPQGLKMLGEQSPMHYMDYLQKASVGQERQLRATAMEGELYDRFKDHGRQGAKAALKLYDENLKYGPEAADEAMRKAIYENWEEAGKMGFPPKWRSPQPLYPDVTALRAGIAADDASRAKPPTPITPYQQVELGIKAKEVERGATTVPTNVEIVQPDGTKEQGTAVYNKDLRTWQRPDGSAIVGTVTEIAKPKESKPYVGTITGPDGKPTEVPIRIGPQGERINVDTGKIEPDIKNLRAVGTHAEGPESEAATDKQAEAIANYQQAPYTGYAARSPAARQVMAKVMEISPDYQATRYPEVAQAMRSFGPGKQGDITRSLNVGIDHLSSLSELISALGSGADPTAIRRLGQFAQTQLGLSSAPTTFDAAKTIIGSELIKAVQGAQGALGDREDIRKSMDRALNPKILNDVVTEYKRLMAGQLIGLETQYEDATGFGPDHRFAFRKKLRPITLEELDKARTPGVPQKTEGGKYDDVRFYPDGTRYGHVKGKPTDDPSAWEALTK